MQPGAKGLMNGRMNVHFFSVIARMDLTVILNALLMIVTINPVPIFKIVTKTDIQLYFGLYLSFQILRNKVSAHLMFSTSSSHTMTSASRNSRTRKSQDDNAARHGTASAQELTKNCQQVYGLSAQRAEGTAPL
jgi:hypothetical protein